MVKPDDVIRDKAPKQVDQTENNGLTGTQIFAPGNTNLTAGSRSTGNGETLVPKATVNSDGSFHFDFGIPLAKPLNDQTNKSSTNGAKDPFDGHGWQSISAKGINQGANGDCFFESTLASVANTQQGKQAIKEMITTNADGTYTVRFPGAKDIPINVSEKDIADAKVSDSATWAKVLETAFLKRNHSGPRGVLQSGGIALLAENTSEIGAMKLLTGKDDVATDQMNFYDLGGRQVIKMGATSPENIGKDLQDAMANDRPVTAGTSAVGVLGLGNDSGPLPNSHAYSVVGYDATTKTVTVRNPWGNMNGTPLQEQGSTVDGITYKGDGQLTMSLDTFTQRFSDINIGGKNNSLNQANHLWNDELNLNRAEYSTVRDLASGNFRQAGQDVLQVAQSGKHLLNEAAYLTTSAVWDHATASLSNPLKLLPPGASEVAQFELDLITNPQQTVSQVVSTAGTIKDKGKDVLDGAGTVKDKVLSNLPHFGL